jgi:hypothetical protein
MKAEIISSTYLLAQASATAPFLSKVQVLENGFPIIQHVGVN